MKPKFFKAVAILVSTLFLTGCLAGLEDPPGDKEKDKVKKQEETLSRIKVKPKAYVGTYSEVRTENWQWWYRKQQNIENLGAAGIFRQEVIDNLDLFKNDTRDFTTDVVPTRVVKVEFKAPTENKTRIECEVVNDDYFQPVRDMERDTRFNPAERFVFSKNKARAEALNGSLSGIGHSYWTLYVSEDGKTIEAYGFTDNSEEKIHRLRLTLE
ncbi:hypothetical protein ACFLRA_02440 [Bdellovibrionota bacterium]